MSGIQITLADEGMHFVDDHPQFNESALLTLFDSRRRSGGFFRIGNRPNEGHAEATFCWFLPDGSALFRFDRAPISDNSAFRSNCISIDVLDPGRQLSARFEGEAHHLASPRLLTNPKSAFESSPKVRTHLDIALEALGPLYGTKPFPGLDVGGHYEQHMCANGVLSFSDNTTAIQALGNRDHSWGPRVWQATRSDRTLWCTFDRDFGVALSITWRTEYPDVYEVIGEVWREGKMTKVVDASVRSEFEDSQRLFHRAFNVRISLADGQSLEMSGRALAIAPLRHRRDSKVTHIGWGMAEFFCDGHSGIGLSEYMDSIG